MKEIITTLRFLPSNDREWSHVLRYPSEVSVPDCDWAVRWQCDRLQLTGGHQGTGVHVPRRQWEAFGVRVGAQVGTGHAGWGD